MQYKVYCLLKDTKTNASDKVLRVKVIADCVNEALAKAKERFSQKLCERKFSIFMYETVQNV